ncbi:MAG TPA: hypothetical protein VM095_05835 [Pyrinomonadaceae bacterium]|nr:hypothetical protein [Pyrinomonadaceae bacterium]
MRNRILGAIGMLWGLGLLLFKLLSGGQTQEKGAYGAGQTGGLIFGGLLLAVGMYYFFKSPAKST